MVQRSARISPTLLISPNSIPILDILFDVSEAELANAASGLAFAKKFGLYQPKLSKLMRSFRVKNLPDLKRVISNISDDEWERVLDYPATRKRLTPFFLEAKPFHRIESTPMSEVKVRDELFPGPVEIAKKMGMIVDSDRYFWGSPQALHELKRDFRLVPGHAVHDSTWYLAAPKRGISHEAIYNPNIIEKSTSVFRSIWDLSFGSERLREIRIPLLRKVFQ